MANIFSLFSLGFVNSFVNIVTLPVVAFFLLLLFFVGAVFQLFSSRINVFGILSMTAILIFYSGHLLIGEHNVIALILFIAAAFLIVIEIFIIGTLLGLLGFLLLIISIVVVSNNMALYGIFLIVIFIISAISLVILMKKNKKRKIPILGRLILTDNTDAESGYSSFDDRAHLVGLEAVTVTPLRPSGIIRLEDARIDAVTEGAFIASGVTVKVIYVEGTRVVVRPLEEI